MATTKVDFKSYIVNLWPAPSKIISLVTPVYIIMYWNIMLAYLQASIEISDRVRVTKPCSSFRNICIMVYIYIFFISKLWPCGHCVLILILDLFWGTTQCIVRHGEQWQHVVYWEFRLRPRRFILHVCITQSVTSTTSYIFWVVSLTHWHVHAQMFQVCWNPSDIQRTNTNNCK